jgi:two-component system response regulator
MELNQPGPPILYAEDDENDVFFVTRAFAKAGYPHLRVVISGREAVDYLGATLRTDAVAPHPALVLLDLNLPFLSGLEVLTWIRQQAPLAGLPVVIFTSSAQPSDIVRAYAAGATAYITKPNAAPQVVEFARVVCRMFETSQDQRGILAGAPGYRPPLIATAAAH